MPAILTHYTFAKKMLAFTDWRYEEAVYLGTQGPDPFFFYGQLPYARHDKNRKEVNDFGTNLHHNNIAPIYAKMMEVAYNDEKNKDLYFAYIQGLFLHYVLDRNCHPYIFSASGFSDEAKCKMEYSILHTYFETMIDSLISHENGTYTSRPQKTLKIDSKELEAISLLWKKTNDLTLKDQNIKEKTFAISTKDYQKTLRLTNTPHLFSKCFTRTIAGKMSLPYCMNIPRSIPNKFVNVDFLNSKHSGFLDFENGQERHDSFSDLIEKASNDYFEVATLINKAKNGEDIEKELDQFVNNLNHDGAKIDGKKIYSRSIWPSYMLPK